MKVNDGAFLFSRYVHTSMYLHRMICRQIRVIYYLKSHYINLSTNLCRYIQYLRPRALPARMLAYFRYDIVPLSSWSIVWTSWMVHSTSPSTSPFRLHLSKSVYPRNVIPKELWPARRHTNIIKYWNYLLRSIWRFASINKMMSMSPTSN